MLKHKQIISSWFILGWLPFRKIWFMFMKVARPVVINQVDLVNELI